MQCHGETSHALKRREKIGLELGLEKYMKTKVFLIFAIFSFFQIALKI